MTARAAAGDAKVVGINTVFGGVMAYEPDGAVDVALDFRDGVFGLRAVDDGEDGVTAFKQRLIGAGIYVFMGGKKAAADHPENADAVGFGGLENVEGQRGAEFAG